MSASPGGHDKPSGEFDLIRTHFAPLAGPGTFALRNDAMVLTPPAGQSLVLTADMMVSAVHFLPDDKPADIARKLLRVNLSDLAAMGATAHGYLLTVAWPETANSAYIADFAAGLAADQATYGVSLLGGDTVATGGDFTLSLTAVGLVRDGHCLTRGGARAGDILYVSGTIGDAALGLDCLQGRLPPNPTLQSRYHLPQPRLALGQALLEQGIASAALDVSDGLVADLTHLATESGLGAVLDGTAVPLSPAAAELLTDDDRLFARIISGGDDYELLFTVPPDQQAAVGKLAKSLRLPLHAVGVMTEDRTLKITDQHGAAMTLSQRGWQHF